MTHWPYLPFLLIWALPILAIEWLAGWRYLWRERRRWPWVVLALGVYFSLADAVAIAAGTWRFDQTALLGLSLGPVPVEEVLFYLLTSAMVVQGFVVFWSGWDDLRGWFARRKAQRTGKPAHPSALSTPATSGRASTEGDGDV
jgi:lycopene cyclase domain-containing protein